MLEHELVKDAASLEQEDEHTELSIKSLIVLNQANLNKMKDYRSKIDVSEYIRSHCRKKLDNFKVPKTIEFVESIPRTDSGKLKRNSLRYDKNEY